MPCNITWKQRRQQWEPQKSKRFILAKQQLCTCITVFCTFLSRRCLTTAWKCLISHFVEDGNTGDGISMIKFEAAEFIFKWCFRSCCRCCWSTKHVGYFAQRSRPLFSLTLEAGNKVLNSRKFLSKRILKFNSLDLDRLFASDLKYLRKNWDLMYITSPNWSKIHNFLYSI